MDRGWTRVVVVATGPSFSVEQAEMIERARARGDWRVMVVSDAWERLHNADVLYGCDGGWWRVIEGGILRVDRIRATFKGELWTQHKVTAEAFALNRIRGFDEDGLTKRPDAINNGKNSGYMAVNLAYLFGAREIVLVGFDMQDGPNGEHHFFGDHPNPLSNRLPFATCLRNFAKLAPDLVKAGVNVVNCTERTALQCFPRANLADVLC